MIRSFLTILIFFVYIYVLFPLLMVERLILKRVKPEWMYKSSTVMVRGVFRLILFCCGTKITVEGKENIPEGQPAMYVSNHRSDFDALILYTQIPGLCGIIGKKELGRIPLLGLWMDSVNCLLLDREDPREGMKTIMAGIEKLKSGVSMLIFPEGTRSRTPEMLPFKEGSFRLALKSNCPVIPIAVTGSDDIFEKHIPWVRSAKVKVTFGKPIVTEGMSREEGKALPARAQEEVQKMLQKQKEEA